MEKKEAIGLTMIHFMVSRTKFLYLGVLAQEVIGDPVLQAKLQKVTDAIQEAGDYLADRLG